MCTINFFIYTSIEIDVMHHKLATCGRSIILYISNNKFDTRSWCLLGFYDVNNYEENNVVKIFETLNKFFF